MGNPECPGCQALAKVVANLEQRVRELEARLSQNASNSSTPPSANPPGAPKPVVKKKSSRSPGAQPGHPPHLKELLPAERVRRFRRLIPKHCAQCDTSLPRLAGPHDPAPTRHQVIELPRVVAQVTEYQGHARTCPSCGFITRSAIPRAVLRHSVGPRLTSTLAYFTGAHGLSKRGVEEIATAVFDAPISLGTVANLEQTMSAALAAPHAEALAAVRAAPVKHADETGWKLAGDLCWLWGAATQTVAAFVIHAQRGAAGVQALLGTTLVGILCTDRWGVYNRVPAERRQVCWAHLKRDFQKILERGGLGATVGRAGLRAVKKVFAAWQAFQEGRLTRGQLETQLDPVACRLNAALIEGALGDDAKVEAFCHNVLKLESALWTFVTAEGVEPTNNHMERLLRRAVLWRKRSFGCWSNDGCRFVERILTVVQTRRLQGRNVLDFLHDALLAHRHSFTPPKLVHEP
jgi:transposase